jgi:hypothetical protein
MRKSLFVIVAMVMFGVVSGTSFAGIDDGLIAHYPFDGNAYDESGYGNNGAVNSATFTTDRFGNANRAYYFDGTDDYIAFTNIQARTSGSVAFTVAGWFKCSSSTNGPLWMWGDSASPSSSYNAESPVGWRNNLFSAGFYGVGGHRYIDYTEGLADGNWHFIVQSSDGSSGYLYADGIYVGSTTHTGYYPSNPVLIAGARTKNSSSSIDNIAYFNGSIDDLRIYNRTLSSSEIQQLLNLQDNTGTGKPKFYGNFAITGGTYSENDDLHQAVTSELGAQYRVADWNDIVSFYNNGGSASAFEVALSQTGLLTLNDNQWYSASRHYYYHISQRAGQTPYDSFLSHANVGNHAFDLGSWYGLDMPILAVKEQSSGNTDDTTRLTGNVRYNGSPVCAMVLANGQYMFTCSGDGGFDLNVPLDSNGQITIYSFCSGLAPFKQVIYPYQSQGFRIDLDASGGGTDMDIDFSTTDIGNDEVRLEGSIRYNGSPVCAMVLANGQYAFTCSGDGSFQLDVPLDSNGEVTIYGFCSGLPPYKYVFKPTTGGGNGSLSMVDLVGNFRITVDTSAYDTSEYFIFVILKSDGTLYYEEHNNGSKIDTATGRWSYDSSTGYFFAQGDGDLCSGTMSSGATMHAFSVPGTFYGASGTYNWLRW